MIRSPSREMWAEREDPHFHAQQQRLNHHQQHQHPQHQQQAPPRHAMERDRDRDRWDGEWEGGREERDRFRGEQRRL